MLHSQARLCTHCVPTYLSHLSLYHLSLINDEAIPELFSPGEYTRKSQIRHRALPKGAAQPAGLPELVGSIYFCSISFFFFVSCWFWFSTCLVAFYPLAFVFFLFIQIYSSPVVCVSHVAGVLSRLLPRSNFVLVCV